MEKSGLEVRHIGKEYHKKPIVRDVSIHISRGEVVGLLGPNGAGKTTCFYMICGLIAPDYGSISLNGSDITDLPMYKRARMGIGYLPQESSIFRGMTVGDNIMTALEVAYDDQTKRTKHLEEILADFSISHLKNAPVIGLSGGERRRVEIARSISMKPNFILLDEPLAGIDPISIEDVKQLIFHLKDRGIGVLITDHNVKDTLEIIDRAYIIADGSVFMEGTPKEVIASDKVRKIYLGDRFSLTG